jgi:uncharacterized protein YbbC (DUF1343 family)
MPVPQGREIHRSTIIMIFNLLKSKDIVAGAERTALYFDRLTGKSIGVICNHTSLVGDVHLVDTLLRAGFNLKVIFSPEHGFRGEAEAGAEITDGTDRTTGVRIISLYGKKETTFT